MMFRLLNRGLLWMALQLPLLTFYFLNKATTVAKAQAQAVKDALLGLPAQVVLGDRIDGITMQGDIIPLGYDENKRPEFSLNFRSIVEPASGTNRISL